MIVSPGKWYRRRDGKIVGPAEQTVSKFHPFKVGDICYPENGRISNYYDSKYDLVTLMGGSFLDENYSNINTMTSIAEAVYTNDKNLKEEESMSKSNDPELKSRPKYPAEKLKDVEKLLIELITGTTHHTALKSLATALSEVRYVNTCLDDEKRFFHGER